LTFPLFFINFAKKSKITKMVVSWLLVLIFVFSFGFNVATYDGITPINPAFQKCHKKHSIDIQESKFFV